jgi:hypothetical protein
MDHEGEPMLRSSRSVPIQPVAIGARIRRSLVSILAVASIVSLSTAVGVAAASGLPDGRAYELVSPVQKHGADIIGIDGFGGNIDQAAENGAAVAYTSRYPAELNPPANGYGTTLLSVRGPNGWSTQDVSPPLAEVTGPLGGTTAVKAFSDDLSSWVTVLGGHGEGPDAPESIRALSPDSPEGIEELSFLHMDGTYTPLATQAESGPLPGAKVEFRGATPDLRHIVVMSSGAKLVPPAVSGEEALYEWSDGRLQLVSLLPNGTQPVSLGGSQNALALGSYGETTSNNRHAISEDGSHVVWSSNAEIYDRDMLTEKTVRVAGAGEFLTASASGSSVLYGNVQSFAVAGGLYEFNLATEHTSDLLPGGGFLGLVGSSADASTIYFVADTALGPGLPAGGECGDEGSPDTGTCNLYVEHRSGEPGNEGWEPPRFVATLVQGDHDDWESTPSVFSKGLLTQTAQVSENGRYLALLSRARLTSYNNAGAQEVYLYDASTNRLTCASCNPSGAAPDGEASLPGWTAYDDLLQSTVYQSRYLSDEGRLFFDSTDALVPQDTNGLQDVYEYEPEGVGVCYISGGCLGLISDGAGASPSSFIDASAGGDDVFFITGDQLVSEDVDGAVDLYDAHVCSSSAPCPTASVTSPPCASDDACKSAISPQPSVFEAPATAGFWGDGNLAAPARNPAATAKPRPLTRAQMLAKALRACRKKPRRTRATCERRANKADRRVTNTNGKGRK